MTAPVGPLGKAHRLFTPADGLHTPWYYGVDDPGPVGAGVVWIVPVPDATTPTSFLFRQRDSANAAWFLLFETALAGGAPAAHAASHEDGGGDALELSQDQITNLVADLAAKASTAYVDAAIAGLSWKASVRVATTGPGTLASDFENGDTVDGVVLATGDRILIKDQAAPAENGIYLVNASGAPTRAADANTAAEVLQASVYVQEGTAHADTQWTMATNAPITLGVTGLTFTQLSTGVADHGVLTGLADDDHTQYLPADGSRPLTGDLDADGNQLKDVADPTDPQDAATKQYVDDEISASGPGGGGSLILIERQVASASAALDFVTDLDDTYDQYELHFGDFVAATDQQDLLLRMSTDGGSSWLAGTNYRWSRRRHHASGFSEDQNGATGVAEIKVFHELGNASGDAAGGRIKLFNLRSTTGRKACFIEAAGAIYNDDFAYSVGGGMLQSATAVNGLQLIMASGNISSGWAALYGVKKT